MTELSVIDLLPDSSVTVTTQFDIPYDDKMQYTVGIIPDRFGLQDSEERGFVCIKNCYWDNSSIIFELMCLYWL